MGMEKVCTLHKALADSTRYQIIALLLEEDLCVGALSKRIQISESAVSQHLKILRQSGLVWGERRGYFTHYSVNKEELQYLANELTKLAETKDRRAHSNCSHPCYRQTK